MSDYYNFINDLNKYAVLSRFPYYYAEKNNDNSQSSFNKIEKKNFFNNYCNKYSNDFLLLESYNLSFGAVCFRNLSNQLVLSIRGTDKFLDILADIDIFNNDLSIHCIELIKFFNEKVAKLVFGDEKIIIIGHSLGGYLAQILVLLYPNKFDKLYTYNAPGVFQDKITENIIKFIQFLCNFGFSKIRYINKTFIFLSSVYKVSKIVLKNTTKREYQQDLNKLLDILQNDKCFNTEFIPASNVFHIKTCTSFDDKEYLIKNIIQNFGDNIKGSRIYLNIGSVKNINPIKKVKQIISTHSIDTCIVSLEFCKYLLKNNYKIDDIINNEVFYINPYNNDILDDEKIKNIALDLQSDDFYKALEYIMQNN